MTDKITATFVRNEAISQCSGFGYRPAPPIVDEADWFLVEAATQIGGFIHLDDAETLTVSIEDFVAFVRRVQATAAYERQISKSPVLGMPYGTKQPL